MNKLLKFFRHEYAMLILCVVFLYFAITFIGGAFGYYKVKLTKPVLIDETSIKSKDRQVEAMKAFSREIRGESGMEEVLVALDITARFTKTSNPKENRKLECWQCAKMIPFEKTVCPFCGAIQKHTDADKDGMPDYWEIRYGFDPEDETDAAEDADGDKYSNLEEYRAGSDPTDPKSTPLTKKFVYDIAKIFRKPVDILFRGYIELNYEYTLEINWEGRGKTFFAKVGDVIHGYSILQFKKIIREHEKVNMGLVIDVDESYITLQRKNGKPFNLIKNKVYIEREVYARLKNKDTKEEVDVHVGSDILAVIEGKKEKFTVTEITIDQVFYQDKKGNINFIFWKQ